MQPPSICQIPALSVHISSEAELEALKRLSSSVNYPGSRNDIAEATRDYVEQPILLTHELATIRVKVQIDHNAEMGQWTYPGWRADVIKALDARSVFSRSPTQLEEMTRNDKLNGSPADSVRETAPKRGVFCVEVCSVERWLRLSARYYSELALLRH